VKRRIVPRRDVPGGCTLRLSVPERTLLAQLPKELEEVLSALASAGEVGGVRGVGASADAPDEPGSASFPPVEGVPVIPPSLKRLFPPAYTGDDDAERNYVGVARADLLDHHRQALQILADTASAKVLDAEQVHGWMTALNDVRLVLGTVLDIREDGEPGEVAVTQQMAVYYYLTGLQNELVEFLSNSLPDPAPGADDQIPDDPWGEPPGGLRWDGTPQPGTEL
jgi:hypothetical protein